MKQSRLLSKLDAAIAASSESVSLHCLQIERACYLIRQGHVGEARATLLELRRRYERYPDAEISSWLSLAEGLLIHFSDMGPLARDKVHRAYALSAATGLTRMNALSAAWLAHLDYLIGNVKGMARFVRQALALAAKDNHAALSRANLVIADAYHLAGRIDLAKPRYGKAHEHASAEGDDATISALMHNMAWLRFANQRHATLNGGPVTPSGELALASVESTLQFEQILGADSLHALSPILRAQILAEKGEFELALTAYGEYLAPAIQQGIGRLHGGLLADQAWCRLNLGQAEAALADALTAEALVDPNGHFDDRASAHGRLAQVFSALGDSSASDRHRALAKVAWEGHSKFQQDILEVLSGL